MSNLALDYREINRVEKVRGIIKDKLSKILLKPPFVQVWIKRAPILQEITAKVKIDDGTVFLLKEQDSEPEMGGLRIAEKLEKKIIGRSAIKKRKRGRSEENEKVEFLA